MTAAADADTPSTATLLTHAGVVLTVVASAVRAAMSAVPCAGILTASGCPAWPTHAYVQL